ncbi:MAG: GGDEF domain-containing protein [Deltaproteobacteria bacterium]|nr:GGDEF domain-containing protein [Deltaproteobacteria bacterium]
MEYRQKIGVIIDSIHESYQSGIWNGIAKRSGELKINLISFIGTSQDGIDFFDTHYDIVEEFARNSHLDGVIVFSGSMTEHHGNSFTKEFCKKLSEIPLITVSEKVEDYPSILVENGSGVLSMVEHFVTHHNLNRIAFVRGPHDHQEAEERYNAYKKGLQLNNIKFDPELVVDGGFLPVDGVNAIKHLIDNNIQFDSVITVSDSTAFGVLKELADQGLHVPGDIAVSGFDDVEEAKTIRPALSTISQPLFDIGKAAVDKILKMADGNNADNDIFLPTYPVFRRSCGCFSEEVQNAKALHKNKNGLTKEQLIHLLSRIILDESDKSSSSFPGVEQVTEMVGNLIGSLVMDVKKPLIRNIFLNEVDILLFKTEKFSNSITLLYKLLKELTVNIATLFNDKHEMSDASDYLQQAQTLITRHKLFEEIRAQKGDSYTKLKISVTSQRIISSFEQREMLSQISKGFPELGIESFTLALFEEEALKRTSWIYNDDVLLLLAYNLKDNKTIFPRNRNSFYGDSIIPREITPVNKAQNLLFLPLFYKDEYLGYTVMEYVKGPPHFMYEELRLHLNSAIKSSMLLKRFKTQSLMDEMTGVFNRRGFFLNASPIPVEAKQTGKDFMLVYADVDGLKQINDTYGHDEGDVVINGCAQVLKETFRDRDIIGRVGGDEFIVALETSELEGLKQRLENRFEINVEKFNKSINKPYKLSVSLGFASENSKSEISLEDLIKHADEMLLAIKKKKHSKLKS